MHWAQEALNWAPLSKGELLLCSPSFSLLPKPSAVLGQEYLGVAAYGHPGVVRNGRSAAALASGYTGFS